MKVEQLLSEGGLRISELRLGNDPCTILRLSKEGETEVRFPGIELNYDPAGKLVLVVVRMVKFAGSQGAEFRSALPAEFWELVDHLSVSRVEVAAEVDLSGRKVELLQLDRFGRASLTTYDLDHFSGTLFPIEVGSRERTTGVMGFMAELLLDENRLRIGVGDTQNVIWAAHPLSTKMKHLDGRVDLDAISKFLKGDRS